MDKKIVLGYNPNVKIEKIQEILRKYFPECDQSVQTWGINAPFMRLKKSFVVHAIIFIKQKPKKNQTIIGINGTVSSAGTALFGLLLLPFHYIQRGSFLEDIRIALEQELSKL